jgi:cbb3-type cytochrome oxidase maturation protein
MGAARMEIIYLLAPLAILLGLVFLIGFIWAARAGQFTDLEAPAFRLLIEDPSAQPEASDNPKLSALKLETKKIEKSK